LRSKLAISTARRDHLVWPFVKHQIDPAEQAKALVTYRRLFTQPKRLATLRVEFDAAVKEGSAHGTNPELLQLLQSHADEITRLMSSHWEPVISGQEQWPALNGRKSEAEARRLRNLFILYVDKTLHWLDYFIRDPRWLNLSAVNYAANAAREAANEVRDARVRFEALFELQREDLVPGLHVPEPTGPQEDRPAA
jgi:hypothetical protein